jgi:uncharacterized alpha-E superfamily protein
MISRVADHCFWLGRYFERAESTSRLLQATRALAFDAELPVQACWRPLVTVSGQHPDLTERLGPEAAGNGELVQRYMTWAPENPVSIRNSIRAAREGARSIREVLSHDIWEATNELYLWFMGEQAVSQYMQDREDLYRHIRRSTQLCLGLVRSTMLHDTPMDFLWMGVLLERIGQTARILDMHHHILLGNEQHHQILQTALWLSLLRACSGSEAFMRRHAGRVSRSGVVHFLLFEPIFPRSLLYCIRSTLSVMLRAWPEPVGPLQALAIERIRALEVWLQGQESNDLPENIHELLTHVIDEVSLTCAAVQRAMSGEIPKTATTFTAFQSQ